MFAASFWQWQSNGFGDARLNAKYVYDLLGDKGITGPERAEEMERIRVLAETVQSFPRPDAKKNDETKADETAARD